MCNLKIWFCHFKLDKLIQLGNSKIFQAVSDKPRTSAGYYFSCSNKYEKIDDIKFQEVRSVFSNSTAWFRITYFASSFIPSYTFLLLILIVQHFELTGEIMPVTWDISTMKIIFYSTLILLLLSICSLFYVKNALENVLKNSKSRTLRSAYITRNYNVGMREFLLSVLVPIMTTISIQDMPITGFISMLFLQILIYFYYTNSSEYLPNLSLQLIKYSVVNAIDSKQNRDVYLFAKSDAVSSLINGNKDFVYFGKLNKNSGVGITVGGEENEN